MRRLLTVIVLALGLAAIAWAGPANDADSDGTPDLLDLCSANATAPSPCSLDTDQDGYGNACDGDFNNDGAVNTSDITPYLGDLTAGTDSGIGSDMNCDGAMASPDITPFLAQLLLGVPGPSGLPCAGTVPCP